MSVLVFRLTHRLVTKNNETSAPSVRDTDGIKEEGKVRDQPFV